MNCCNSFGHCTRGADCPVRRQNAKITLCLSQEITAQLDADLQVGASPLATANSDGSDPFFSPAISLMPAWLEELGYWCLLILLAVSFAGLLGLLASHFTGR